MAIIPHRKHALLHFVAEAVNEGGWNIIYLNNEHPFKIKIYNGEESYFVKLIIYNISHGGGRKRAPDEFRIQMKEEELRAEPPYKTLILGYYDALGVFAGWDFSKHIGRPAYSASFQIKEDNLNTAAVTGFSPYNKGNGEIAIAFRPDFFVEYVRTLETLHTFGEVAEDFEVLAEVTSTEVTPNDETVQQVTAPRRKVLQSITKTQRDNSFRKRILRAYNYKCAYSGIQLRLVDAAHIVPVNYEGSTDETSNGVALSALHHKAYDKGLISFDDQYRSIVNQTRIEELRQLNLHGGLNNFLNSLRPVIDVPPARNDRPNVAYIRTANQLRGWN